MPFVTVPANDPRCQLTAFVSDSQKRLYEVVDDRRGVLVLEDAMTGQHHTVSRVGISAYRLERGALACPDSPQPEPVNSD